MKGAIDEAVDTALQMFMSMLPESMAPDDKEDFQKDWLLDHYVRHVAEAVERCKKAKWVFEPALPLEHMSDEERHHATELYARVDEAAAAKIDAAVGQEIQKVLSALPSSSSAAKKGQTSQGLVRGQLCQGRGKSLARSTSERLRIVDLFADGYGGVST